MSVKHGQKGIAKRMETIKLRDEYIKLGQALKAAGFVESGVDAKYAIEDGLVYVNGEQAFQRGKKLSPMKARPSKLLNKSLKENFYDHRIHRT